MKRRYGRLLAIIVVGALGCSLSAMPATAAGYPPVSKATGWLLGKQQVDGGFEVAAFPGFETPDAAFAFAAAAQGTGWDVCVARAAVLAARNGAGKTALDALDDLADSQGSDVGIAAKLVVLAVMPLGLDPSDFDPANDSEPPVDLLATIRTAAIATGGSVKPGALNTTAYAVMALMRAQGLVIGPTLDVLRNAQRVDGSWNFAGSLTDDGDVDTTATVLQALLSVGFSPNDDVIAEGLAYLARAHNGDGSWSSFGSPDPNSTATAIMAIRAAGFDPASSVWRNAVEPKLASVAYASPYAFLLARQQSSGRIASPNDGYGINTFATSQAAQALAGATLLVGVPNGACVSTEPTPSTTTTAQVVSGPVTVLARPRPRPTPGATVTPDTTAATTPEPAEPQVAGTAVSTSTTTTTSPPVLPNNAKGSSSGLETAIAIGLGVSLLIAAGVVLVLRKRIPGT